MSLFYEVMALVGYRISKMSQGHFWYEKKTSHHFLLRFSGDRILLTSIFYLAIGWKLSIVFFGKIFETNTGSLYKFWILFCANFICKIVNYDRIAVQIISLHHGDSVKTITSIHDEVGFIPWFELGDWGVDTPSAYPSHHENG